METIQFEYLNLIAAYILHALVESQSMGKLLYAFKNVRNMEKFLEDNAHAPDGTQPILARVGPARPWRKLFHFPSVAYASMRATISWRARL